MLIEAERLTLDEMDWVITSMEMKRRDSLGEPVEDSYRKKVMAGEYYDSYSTNWALAGAIIEREHIELMECSDTIVETKWDAYLCGADGSCERRPGDTLLIAAMCVYASTSGDDYNRVEVPDVLRKMIGKPSINFPWGKGIGNVH